MVLQQDGVTSNWRSWKCSNAPVDLNSSGRFWRTCSSPALQQEASAAPVREMATAAARTPQYHPSFCEENVYWLCSNLGTDSDGWFAVFISNPAQQVQGPRLSQKAC